MANPEHMNILKKGVHHWNEWRELNPNINPDLANAQIVGRSLRFINLKKANLVEADLRFTLLSRANLSYSNLQKADLRGVSLRRADLTGANLSDAILRHVTLAECKINDTTFKRCHIYGIAAWNLYGEPKDQSGLIIRAKEDDPAITIDDLEIAHFIFLLLSHKKLRNVINAVTEKGVLILGRFAEGGIDLLQSIAGKLKELDYIPYIFDFDRPKGGNYTETVKTLVGLSRFVVAELSGPSVPQELYATVPHFKIPFVPIIHEGKKPHGMLPDILEYPWVLQPPVVFKSKNELIDLLPSKIIKPAEKKYKEREKRLRELFFK